MLTGAFLISLLVPGNGDLVAFGLGMLLFIPCRECGDIGIQFPDQLLVLPVCFHKPAGNILPLAHPADQFLVFCPERHKVLLQLDELLLLVFKGEGELPVLCADLRDRPALFLQELLQLLVFRECIVAGSDNCPPEKETFEETGIFNPFKKTAEFFKGRGFHAGTLRSSLSDSHQWGSDITVTVAW
jgi:hypothetical protein